MLSFGTILSATAPVFLVIFIGFALHRKGWLGEELEVGLMKLALNLFVPCLILSVIPGNPALEEFSSALWAAGFGIGAVLAGFLVAAVIGWMVRLRKGDGLRTYTIATGIQNYGYLPIPIIAELFSEDSGPMGLIFVHGVGVEFAMWSVGLAILTGKSGWRSIVNGPFLAVVGALFLNYSGAYRLCPSFLTKAIEMLGQCAIPISIFMIGATIGRFFDRSVFASQLGQVAMSSVLTRIVVMGVLILAAAKYLPISRDLKQLMVIQAAMPAAVFPIMLSRIYGGQPSVAIQVVLVTSLVSVVTSPLVIAFGLKWLDIMPVGGLAVSHIGADLGLEPDVGQTVHDERDPRPLKKPDPGNRVRTG